MYSLVARAAPQEGQTPVRGAYVGGSPAWLGDPLELDGRFLFKLSLVMMNAHIDGMRQMMDVASIYGFHRDLGAYGPCLSQG